MAKFDIFFSYSNQDAKEAVEALKSLLRERGIVSYDPTCDLSAGVNWEEQIRDAISNADVFIPIITEGYLHSEWYMAELEAALTYSKSRSKRIIPLVAVAPDMVPASLQEILWLSIDKENITTVAEIIAQGISSKTVGDILYESLAEYMRLKDGDKTAETISALLLFLSGDLVSNQSIVKKRETYKEVYRLYGLLLKYTGRYDEESRALAHTIINALDAVNASLNKDVESGNDFTRDLYACAFAVQTIYLDRDIRSECADVLTNGDVSNPCPVESYVKKQAPFAVAFKKLYADGYTNDKELYSEEEWDFIIKASTCIFDLSTKDNRPVVRDREVKSAALSETDEILLSIAHFMQEGNKLFDLLQKTKVQGSFLRCLLTSYERLKAYCEIVGAGNIASECVDRIVEIRNTVDKQEDIENADGKAEKGIKSLLGLTLQGSGEYDVFISFKNEDSDLAEKIYKYCQKHLKEPFWSKRTLPELSKSEYEDAIYDALRKSKHFFVVLSKLEYLNANWIKKEMATFDRAITEGRKKGANFVFVVTDDVYKQIIDSNKECFDERYCGYQIIKMSDYENTLYKYLT